MKRKNRKRESRRSMKNRYDSDDAKRFIRKSTADEYELALRVYISRLIGSDSGLVLHGGGNTSVKSRIKGIVGDEIDVLFVKGSGWDLATIEPEGFTGLLLDPIRKLRRLDFLSDDEMENQLAVNRIDSRSPNPSVEALLHAFLPHKYIDHTHAESILILTNQKQGEDIVKRALGDRITVIPYVMSGFPLAKAVADAYESNPEVDGIVVMHHGIFTFSENAKTAYDHMIRFVTKAETYIEERLGPGSVESKATDTETESWIQSQLCRVAPIIRGAVSRPGSGERFRRFCVASRTSPELVSVSSSPIARDMCRSGVLTPDHAIRTKHQTVFIDQIPENDDDLKNHIQRSIESFKSDFMQYCNNRPDLDPYPILFLVSGLGLLALGDTQRSARISADIGERTIQAKMKAYALGDYVPIETSHVLDMECWNLQRKKLEKTAQPLQGQIAFITGGAGAIGFGIAKQVLAAGAVVVISDIDPSRLTHVRQMLTETFDEDRVLSIVMDVTDMNSVESAYRKICNRIGGVGNR